MTAMDVLDYLATKPDGEYSLEGITNWWMRSDKGKHALEELEDILNLMIARGELTKGLVKKDIVVYTVKKRLNV